MAKTHPKANRPARGGGDNAQWATWFFENAQDLFVILRPKGRLILAANSVWERVTGWRVDEIVGRDLFDFVWPEDASVLRAMRPQMAAGGATLKPFRLRRKDGDWLWLEGYAREGPDGEIMAVVRDITEERHRRIKLESADQLRFLLSETAGVGLWRYDPRTEGLEWSAEILALLRSAGVSMDDANSFNALCHPDDLDRVTAAIDAVVATGRPMAYDHRLRAADGRWIHMRVHVTGEPIGDGLHMVHGISQNITELAEAREAAQSAEAQSRRLVEQAPFAVALFDADLRYAMASRRWIELFRLEGLNYLGFRLDELSNGIYADFVRMQTRALAGEVVRTNESELVDTRGHVYWLRWELRPWRDASGAIAGVVVYVDDISDITFARREAQAHALRLRIALGAARAAVVETDFQRETVWSSPELVDLCGFDLTGSGISGEVWPFIHPLDRDRMVDAVRSWSSGDTIEPLETRILTPDGEERWVRIYTEIEKDERGAWRKSVSLLIDIDDSKRQQLALIEAERAAQAAAEAKSQFLANMSHEIRTPMNGVLGVLHLLERQPLPPPARAMLAEALACGRMLQALLDDVVDFSRIEAGRLELESEPMDPAAVLDSVVGLLRPQAEGKGLEVRVETDGLPSWMLGDPVRLRQCLFNLMGNAVKFTPQGRIVVRAIGRDGPVIRFEFEDTGVGIDMPTQQRLFQRFQQADTTTTRRFGGSGLGLAITRKLAELMGGSVDVRSTPGVGSVFWLEIPAPTASGPRAAPAPVDGVLDGLRVLVVEDNPTNRMIATKILENLGAAVETAEDGEQGVAAAARGGFDLILMDIQMPGIDGVEATRRIRALASPAAETPVVALTANVLTHQRDTYLAAGMSGVVAKPVSPAALLAEIARLAGADETPRRWARRSPHRPDCRPARHGQFAGDLETEALIDRDVARLAGLQIGGGAGRIDLGQSPADDHPAIALALLSRIGPDRLEIPVRFMRVMFLDETHDAHGPDRAADPEQAEELRAIDHILPDRDLPLVGRAPEGRGLIAARHIAGSEGQAQLEQQFEQAWHLSRAGRRVRQHEAQQRIVEKGVGHGLADPVRVRPGRRPRHRARLARAQIRRHALIIPVRPPTRASLAGVARCVRPSRPGARDFLTPLAELLPPKGVEPGRGEATSEGLGARPGVEASHVRKASAAPGRLHASDQHPYRRLALSGRVGGRQFQLSRHPALRPDPGARQVRRLLHG
jgi:PAS domain S-box-containing protein